MSVLVFQVGRVARDPVSATFGNDMNRSRTTIRVLTTDVFGSGDERREQTEGTTYVIWGPAAVAADKLLRQGDLVEIHAEKCTRQYKDNRSGELKWITEFIVTKWKRHLKASAKPASAETGGGVPPAGDDDWVTGASAHGGDLPPLDMDSYDYPLPFDESAPN